MLCRYRDEDDCEVDEAVRKREREQQYFAIMRRQVRKITGFLATQSGNLGPRTSVRQVVFFTG